MSNLAQRKFKSNKKRKKRRVSKSFKLFKRRLNMTDYLLLVILLSLFCVQFVKWSTHLDAQPQVTVTVKQQRQAFIKQLVTIAQAEQKRAGVLASITLAQAALESDWGQSELAQKYHNLFGVKSGSSTSGALMTTQEYLNGQWITVKARFAIYASWQESVQAHTQLFLQGTNWDKDHYQAVLTANNYYEAAQALQDAGYATDPNYARKITELIQEYNLNQYD